MSAPPDDVVSGPLPKAPGFYWRRVFHFGDTAEPGWRWSPTEVYMLGGSLMTSGYLVAGSHVVWGPRLTPPLIPTDTEVKLARALLAWMRLGDRGFGPPAKWKAYNWHGWKLDMAGSEEWFDDEHEAVAVKKACEDADGLADSVIARALKGST